jgi:Lrp/AsnC family leucine-responsive transcriptional regulator
MEHMFNMKTLVDEKNEKILDILEKHSEYTVRQIGKLTGLPPTTVYSRIQQMKKDNVIKAFTVKTNPKKRGKFFASYIVISVDYGALRELKKDQHKLAAELGKLAEVEMVDIITGEFDLLVKVRTEDVDAYDHFLLHKLQKIKGIGKTQSMVIIHEES